MCLVSCKSPSPHEVRAPSLSDLPQVLQPDPPDSEAPVRIVRSPIPEDAAWDLIHQLFVAIANKDTSFFAEHVVSRATSSGESDGFPSDWANRLRKLDYGSLAGRRIFSRAGSAIVSGARFREEAAMPWAASVPRDDIVVEVAIHDAWVQSGFFAPRLYVWIGWRSDGDDLAIYAWGDGLVVPS